MNELYKPFREVFIMSYIFTRFTMYQFNFQQSNGFMFSKCCTFIDHGVFNSIYRNLVKRLAKNIHYCCSNIENTQKCVYKKSRVCFFCGLMSSGSLADKKEVCLMSLTLRLNKTSDIKFQC